MTQGEALRDLSGEPEGEVLPEPEVVAGELDGERLGEAVGIGARDTRGEAEGAMRSAAAGMAMPWKLYSAGAVATTPHCALSVLNTR